MWLILVSLTSLLACSSTSGGADERDGGGAAGGATGGADVAGAAGAPGSAGKSTGEGGRTEGNGGNAGASSMAGKATGGSEAQGGSSTQGGAGGADKGETGPQEYGFTLRKPGEKQLDWLCTFNSGVDSGYVYVRLLQTGMKSTGIAMTPVYEAELAQISLKGAVTALQNPEYDYGGGHHNDALSFDYGGKTHRYYHSSFGFGFRSCQAMDCRNVYAPGTTTLETEGCTSARSLPEVCVAIDSDATHAPLVDNFMKCPGDAG